MALKEWLKKVFPRVQVPEETRDALAGVTTERDAVKALDALRAGFLIDLRDIEEEIISVSRSAEAQEELIRAGGLPPAAERTVLQRVEREQKRLASLERRQASLNAKVNIQQDMADAILEAEIMRLQGITEERIDEVLALREERTREWVRVLAAGRDVAQVSEIDPEGDRRREALKQKILGKKTSDAPAAPPDRKRDIE